MATQYFDDPDRIRQRQKALEVLSQRSGRDALVRRAALAREVAEMQRRSGREVTDLPSNFLPPSQDDQAAADALGRALGGNP
jgi:hypothetical protein